jgi:hypothetical protein
VSYVATCTVEEEGGDQEVEEAVRLPETGLQVDDDDLDLGIDVDETGRVLGNVVDVEDVHKRRRRKRRLCPGFIHLQFNYSSL